MRALESFTRARSFKCFTCFANNYEKWSNCIHLVWDEQKKCSLCTMQTLPVHVFSQRCSTLPFFTEDCLLWKYLFYFPLSEDFPSCMKSPVEGETHYSASLHFCAFGLLECIVTNQRNKGTWMGRGERCRGTEWAGSALEAAVTFPFPAHPSGAALLHEDAAALQEESLAWGAESAWGCCAARHMGSLDYLCQY